MNKKRIFVFVHNPKTASSTFRKHIIKNVTEKERLLLSHNELGVNPDPPNKNYKINLKLALKLLENGENDYLRIYDLVGIK